MLHSSKKPLVIFHGASHTLINETFASASCGVLTHHMSAIRTPAAVLVLRVDWLPCQSDSISADSPYLNIAGLERPSTSERCGEVGYCQSVIRHCVQSCRCLILEESFDGDCIVDHRHDYTSLSSLSSSISTCCTVPLVITALPTATLATRYTRLTPNSVTSAKYPSIE